MATTLVRCAQDDGTAAPNRLGYVPMDTLWLLAEAEEDSLRLGRLVALLEESDAFGRKGALLYEHLLHTLGRHAVGVYLERVQAVAAVSETDERLGLLGNGIARLARQEAVALEDAVTRLLRSGARSCRAIGLAVLAQRPLAGTLDTVWRLHLENRARLSDEGGFRAHEDYDATSRALVVGIADDPSWLRDRIMSPELEGEELSTLAFQLEVLEHEQAGPIWRETRIVLVRGTRHRNEGVSCYA